MSDLNHHIYEVDELVIGNSLEAVSYCYLNERTLILNNMKKPYFFEFFEKSSCLKKYTMESIEYELATPNGKKLVGPSKLEAWERLVFYLSMSGLIPVADKVYSLRIEDDKILKITTNNSRVVRIKFDKLRIFNTEKLTGFDMSKSCKKHKVVDWVDVRSGMKHEYDYFETKDSFVREVYFYPSHRMGSGEKDDRKDLVSVSYLTKEQLDDFEYSDTYVKFKILNLMKEAGIKGPKNGRRVDDPNKWAHHSIKIEPSSREVCVDEDLPYESEGSLIFDNRGERDIYLSSGECKGYLNKFSRIAS